MAENVIEGVNPTRMELLAIKKKKKLAQKGHKLLGQKRDALVVEFFKVIKQREELREEVSKKLGDSYESLIDAEMVMGQREVTSIASSYPGMPSVPVSTLNIMGTRVPQIQSDLIDLPDPYNYSVAFTTQKLDSASTGFQDSLKDILRLGEIEGTIVRLASEIEKTKRRVNALEHIFIPRLRATEKYIEMQLQEREREDFFRRKRIKALMQSELE